MQLSKKEISVFQKKILGWYQKNKRDLPWRKSRDPYSILVSEVMLQQTQVPRVIPKFEEWMKKFPTVQSLLWASNSVVLRLWSGLGYNRRAIFLQKTAQIIVQEYGGKFPQNHEELKKLPGIGEYTASAVLCFAFNKQIAIVDTNIRKVVTLTFFNGIPPDKKTLQQIADRLLPAGKAYEWNQALMDYSSVILKKEKVPVPKQSNFLTSKRYIRGQIIKLLLAHDRISEKELIMILESKTVYDSIVIKKIIKQLETEGFISIFNTIVSLF